VTQPAPRPLWRRRAFWAVVGAGVVVVTAVTVGAALGATAPRDYDVRVR
jgi:hypothetical protein